MFMDILSLLFGIGYDTVSYAVAWFVPVAIAAASAISKIAGSAMQNNANAKAVADTNAQNYKMFLEQNMWNERMWNQNNEYNSPSAWYDRMRDAGLNPSYYGMDGGSSQPQSATPPTMQAPQYDYSGYSSAIGDAANLAMDLYLQKEEKEANLVEARNRADGVGWDAYGKQYAAFMSRNQWYDDELRHGRDWHSDSEYESDLRQEQKYKEDVIEVHNKEQQQRKDNAEKTRLELSILQEGADSLKQMPAKELEKLEKTLKSLDLDNDKKQWDKELRDKGLDPSLNWIQQLFYMAMHDKSAYRSCIQSLFEAVKDVGSYFNPFSKE